VSVLPSSVVISTPIYLRSGARSLESYGLGGCSMCTS